MDNERSTACLLALAVLRYVEAITPDHQGALRAVAAAFGVATGDAGVESLAQHYITAVGLRDDLSYAMQSLDAKRGWLVAAWHAAQAVVNCCSTQPSVEVAQTCAQAAKSAVSGLWLPAGS